MKRKKTEARSDGISFDLPLFGSRSNPCASTKEKPDLAKRGRAFFFLSTQAMLEGEKKEKERRSEASGLFFDAPPFNGSRSNPCASTKEKPDLVYEAGLFSFYRLKQMLEGEKKEKERRSEASSGFSLKLSPLFGSRTNPIAST